MLLSYRNTVEFIVYGKYALFSDPITRVGGEKFSYQVPTYQALKGILESVYWKPTFIWYIDAVRVMKKIQTQSKGMRPIIFSPKRDEKNDLAIYTYLKDVSYQVRAHFDWNQNRQDLVVDRNEHKHHNIAKRMIERGGRRDVFLGTRECQGYVKPCTFGEGEGYYDDYGEINFGVMFHGFDYPDETGKNELSVRLWKNVVMKDGIIEFPLPAKDSQEIEKKFIKESEMKIFTPHDNFVGADEPEFKPFWDMDGENK